MKSSEIPFAHLQSWMHSRIQLPIETVEDRVAKYLSQSDQNQKIDCLMSALLVKTGALKKSRRWLFYRSACWMAYGLFRGLNWLEVRGRNNIPKTGAIFIVNHTSAIDPAILMGALRIPFGFFVDSGYGWMADTLERLYGFVSHQGSGEEIIEKMIRVIYGLNPFFAIWPEGYYEKNEIVQGFSGIIRSYAVLNSDKDRIPFIPVIIQGGQCYRFDFDKRDLRMQKIRVDVFEPRYLPRSWLQRPENGGKTPRQIIDCLMLILARKLGQNTLGKSWYLRSSHRE